MADAAFVAQNAHNISNNKRVTTLSNQNYGVIVPNNSPYEPKRPQTNLLDFTKLPKQGSFETDIPHSIVKAKIVSGRLQCTISWEKRPNGIKPEDSVISNSDVKKWNPLLLCEFYEKICKVKKHE
jgi:hypothetical protein